jgi:hypothetical protein
MGMPWAAHASERFPTKNQNLANMFSYGGVKVKKCLR